MLTNRMFAGLGKPEPKPAQKPVAKHFLKSNSATIDMSSSSGRRCARCRTPAANARAIYCTQCGSGQLQTSLRPHDIVKGLSVCTDAKKEEIGLSEADFLAIISKRADMNSLPESVLKAAADALEIE